MWFPCWLTKLIGSSQPARSGRPRLRRRSELPRLQVEQLEDRTLLSAGALDPTFGDGGRLATSFVGASRDEAWDMAVQADGKIVAVGTSSGSFAVTRYNPGGTLDAGFGSGGQVTTSFATFAVATGVVIQPDDKIVVVGSSGMVRYNPNGTLDS